MDANGNFTSMDDFKTGQIVRFISWLDPQICMGIRNSNGDGSSIGVRRIADGNPDHDKKWMVVLDGSGLLMLADPTNEYLRLSWRYLSYENENVPPRGPLVIGNWGGVGTIGLPAAIDSAIALDRVEDCWFALNHHTHQAVIDISGSNTNLDNPIIAFPWNGGDNQKWRCCPA